MRTLLLAVLLLCACPGGYPGRFSNATSYTYKRSVARKTSAGVRYLAPLRDDSIEFRQQLDVKTWKLHECLQKVNPRWVVRTDWFLVLVPADWYVSSCSGRQLFPSRARCQLCKDKGLDIPDRCCGVYKPTTSCPCVCNFSAVIQDNFVIVTTPSLLLYRAELARLVTNINNPWLHPEVVKCVRGDQ